MDIGYMGGHGVRQVGASKYERPAAALLICKERYTVCASHKTQVPMFLGQVWVQAHLGVEAT
jgi:hypothetical protein